MPWDPTTPAPGAKLEMDLDTAGAWRERFQRAQRLRTDAEEEFHWKENIAAYLGKPLTAVPSSDWVNVNKDYAVVRQKAAQLFYKTPEVQLTALEPLMTGREQDVQTFQAVLDSKLGVRGLHVKRTIDQAIFSVLTCGIGPTHIGYENATVAVEVPIIDPSVLPPGSPPPPMVPVEVPVVERWFWEPVSPQRVLLPQEFSGDDFDQAAWIGLEFWKDLNAAKREYDLPDDFEAASQAPPVLTGDTKDSLVDPMVHGYLIWYRASVYDATVVNWERTRLVVFLDGADYPVRHEDSPHQTLDDKGQLTKNSLQGYPIHPLVLNTVPDVAYPPSDTAMIRPLVNELCKGRTQMIQNRDRSLPMRFVDKARIGGEEGVNKILQNVNQGLIPIDGLDAKNPPMIEVVRAQFPRENFTFNDYTERDIAQSLAMGANQRGTENDTVRTASEVRVMQANVDVRLAAERQKVIDWFVRGVEKFATLVQRYAGPEDYIEVVGPDGQRSVQTWSGATIQGRFAYTIRPDSSLYVDAGDYRRQLIDAYNYLARDPMVNRGELLADVVRAFNMDPTKVITQRPPEKKPEPPSVTYRFGGDDLNPMMPQFPIVLEILRQSGLDLPLQAVQAAQAIAQGGSARVGAAAPAPGAGPQQPGRPVGPSPGHPGMAERAEVLNRHQDDVTGGVSGVTR